MFKSYAAALVLSIGCASPALAGQGPVFGGPLGATDLGNAYLPSQAGVYLGVTDAFGYALRSTDNNHNLTAGASAANVGALYGMYVYPFTLFGGNLASGIQGAYEGSPGHVVIRGSGRAYFKDVGWRDLYVDIVNYSRYIGPVFGEHEPPAIPGHFVPYGLTLKAEYSMILPVGHYEVSSAVNPGSNTFFYIPNAAITYLTPPDRLGGGIEFNAHVFYDKRGVNPANDYANGDVLDIDFAVGQKMGRWTAGIAGAYATQLTGDKIGPTSHQVIVGNDGDYIEDFSLGPILTVGIPAIHGLFKIKAGFSVQAQNTLLLNNVVANLFFPFP